MLAKAYNNVPIMPEPKDKNSLQRKVISIGVPMFVKAWTGLMDLTLRGKG